jgi:hypothetical protein
VTDFDYIPIETTEGHRPPSPAADRLLIGLAAVALCGGLLIAAGNFLGADDEVSVASESPVASAEASRTPRPTRSPRPRLEMDVQPAELPSRPPEPVLFSGWIRANTDLVIRALPQVDSNERGILAAGSFAQADETIEEPPGEQGWLRVNSPPQGGWVATLDGDTPLAHRYANPPYIWGAGIWTIAAGGDTFVAIGNEAGRSDQRTEMAAFASTDGARWRLIATPHEWAIGWNPTIAWGPVGWLTATVVDDAGVSSVWLSRSDDLRAWEPLGVLRDLPNNSWLNGLVASERGYLLSTNGSGVDFWFSSDGVTWRETADVRLNGDASLHVVATSAGFYAWQESWDAPGTEPAEAELSVDGRSWTTVTGGPAGSGRQIVSVGDRLLGMDIDPVSGEPRMWVGMPGRGLIAWLPDTDSGGSFRGAAPAALVSNGTRAVAFGWDQATEQALVWKSEPTGWRRSELPDAYVGIPRIAAGGPSGFVVVGQRPTARGSNPLFWHLTDGGSWAPERSPIFPVTADPAGEECPAAPRDAVEFATLDRQTAAICLGDQAFTFRTYAVRCDGCSGGGDPRYQPAWLAGQAASQLFLSPIVDESGGWYTNALVHPSLAYDSSWPGNWLEVTGHLDDPESLDCRWTPPPQELLYYEGRHTTIDQCRQQFVVTEVRVVSGP